MSHTSARQNCYSKHMGVYGAQKSVHISFYCLSVWCCDIQAPGGTCHGTGKLTFCAFMS